MTGADSCKPSRKPLPELTGLLFLTLGLLLSVSGQERPQWQIVHRLPAQTERAFYVDRETDSPEPEIVTRSPILEAIFFIDELNGWAVGDRGHVVRTRDGGQTWSARKLNSPLHLQGIFFHNQREGWVVGNAKGSGVILKTDDGGDSWRAAAKIEGFRLSAAHDVWFADKRHGWVAGEVLQDGAGTAIILATQDGGIHWQPQYLAKERSSALNAIRFTDARRGWAVGHNVVLHTQDSGEHWREQRYSEGDYVFDIDFLSPDEGWAVGGQGLLLYTADGGDTWHARQLPSKYRNLWLSSVKFVNPLSGWVVGDEGTILFTNDGGRTWGLESAGASEYLRDLAATSSSIFASGNDGIILRRKNNFSSSVAAHSYPATQAIKLYPLDEAPQDASFGRFRNELLKAASDHDEAFILSVLDPGIINGADVERGVEQFKSRWGLGQPDSRLWEELTTLLTMGGSFRPGAGGGKEFCAPYVTSRWPSVVSHLPKVADPLDYYVSIEKTVAVRSAPDAAAPIVASLSYDLVEVQPESTLPGRYRADSSNWLKIRTLTGEEGYVPARGVRSPSDYQACFKKVGDKWRMTELASRE